MGDAEDARVSRFEGLGTARREKLEGTHTGVILERISGQRHSSVKPVPETYKSGRSVTTRH